MQQNLDFIQSVHGKTKRNYLSRAQEANKAQSAAISKQFGFDYFDGDRRFGYGGYKYDGRWVPVAERMARHFGLKPGDRILDIGCGKGFLVHDFMKVAPGVEAFGIDISEYAITHAMPEVAERLRVANATALPFPDGHFDLVFSINTLHNLRLPELEQALHEIERVGRGHKYVVNDSYRNEEEKVNLLNWQLTCECFFTPEEWRWVFDKCGYTGDHGFIFFE